MLDEKVNDETTEKFNMQIRLENRLKYMQAEKDLIAAEKDLIAAERDELSVEVDKAFDLIKALSKFVDSENEDVKKVLYPFREILKDSNV